MKNNHIADDRKKVRLIDANALFKAIKSFRWFGVPNTLKLMFDYLRIIIRDQPTVDAVVLPKGKPGDFLEWDNGTGLKQIYRIQSVMICPDCMRYDIEICSPVVDHPNIVRILSFEEAEKEWKEMCARAKDREEPNLTAKAGDGNA